MTDPTATGPAAQPSGITAEALRLFSSLTRHLQALAALAGAEGREAATLYIRLAIVLGAALLFAAFGYVFLVLFVAFAVAHFFHVAWLWISLGLGLLHLLGALIGGLYFKAHIRTPVFRATAEEIRKDASSLRGGQAPTA